MMMNKAFNKYMDGAVGRINTGRECSYKLRISVLFYCGQITAPAMVEGFQCNPS